jgi:hypothetical protein
METKFEDLSNIIYAGGVSTCGNDKAVRGQIIHNKIVKRKYFAFSNYDNSENKAREAAEAWRRETSDKLGLTVQPPPKHDERTKDLCAWIAGFLDGDGCIRLNGSKNHPEIFFTQSCNSDIPAAFQKIALYYGGKARKITEGNSVHRISWRLAYSDAMDIRALLHDTLPHLQLKLNQAKWMHQHINSEDETEQKELSENIKQAKTLESYQSVQIEPDRLSAAYVAGLFDAEGCCKIPKGRTTIRISLSQTSSPTLLEAIWRKCPHYDGKKHNNKVFLELSSTNAYNFLKWIQPFSVQKAAEIKILIESYDDTTQVQSEHRRMNEEEQALLDWRRDELHRLKNL